MSAESVNTFTKKIALCSRLQPCLVSSDQRLIKGVPFRCRKTEETADEYSCSRCNFVLDDNIDTDQIIS